MFALRRGLTPYRSCFVHSHRFSSVGVNSTVKDLSESQKLSVSQIGDDFDLMSRSANVLSADQCRDYARVLLREAHLKEKNNGEKSADKTFDVLDENHDGMLSRREFSKWYKENYQVLLSKDEADAAESTTDIPKLEMRDIGLICVRAMIPYVGFGVCDNALMIIFGDIIDQTIGVKFCLTTMAAAGFGNLISCSTGVFTGGLIDRWVSKIGLPTPNLTEAQRESPQVRNASMAGSLLGIMTGCLLGMFPLLFLEEGFFKKDKHEQGEAAA